MKLLLARIASVLVAASILVGAGAVSAQAAPQDDVLSLTNAQRSSAGIAPLTRDSALDAAAQQWANEMSNTRVFAHSSNEWRAARIPAGWTTHGENIAYGYGSASAVMTGWMRSEGHRANILRSSFTRMGVGYVASGNYWVQIFAGYPAVALPPVGTIDIATATVNGSTATIAARGWVADRINQTAAIPVHVYVTDPSGDVSTTVLNASGSRPDVGQVYPFFGPNHGYEFSRDVSEQGTYRVCVYAIGTPSPTTNNALIGCRSVSFGPSRPVGFIDEVGFSSTGSGPTLSVRGWSFDDALRPAASQVFVEVTSPAGVTTSSTVPTSTLREDVGNAYAGAGPNRGYLFTAPVTAAGTYRVCVSGVGAAVFGSPQAPIGCRSVTVTG